MEISIHNNWVCWNLLLRVNLSKTDAIAPPWTLKHVDWFQCIGSRVQVVGWTNLLWPENCTDVCISSAQQQQHWTHSALQASMRPHCMHCALDWVTFTYCALWTVHCALSSFHTLRTVASGQSRKPPTVCLSATLLSLPYTYIGECRIDCWNALICYEMSIGVIGELSVCECHHVFDNCVPNPALCSVPSDSLSCVHSPVFCFPNQQPSGGTVVESGCLPITEHCPL